MYIQFMIIKDTLIKDYQSLYIFPSLDRKHHLSLLESIVPGVNIVAEASQAVL